ncbi:aspartate/glutamate racemase family protein [Blastomonas fulva]|uniref:aspartate/glutamate racemase family protein n=1 Tax=Blastomonas fulva TaxID=1550728 RepID=UPI0025A43F78|nr:aspartate/glutamate racemase family protein [Blastomonas fulva]MDM7966146.1 aspartate/glutamate racemase family protein [Blastomonas fulva]
MRRIGLIGTVPNPLQRTGPAPELAVLLPGLELVAYPSRVPAFPYTPLEQAMQALGHAEAALQAAEDGCGAVVIDSVGDYGLAAMRAMLPVPAIGSGEAGLAEAQGRRFGIVTVWPESMNFILSERLSASGCAHACIGIVNVGEDSDTEVLAGPGGYLAQVREGREGVVGKVLAGVAELAARGAQAVMLGCTCMSGMADGIADTVDIPIINPLAAGVRAAITAPPLSVTPHLREGRADLLRAMVAAVADEPAEDCPVCIG